ncbi:hypothetical protein M513_08482 [Trichuris suis]|uniref:DDE-1 domain-containing protein n=1 Tax=Trichuris suis TaxID=68888 RepID=A0A085M0C9_9BILA|nr:hypothetical protein M513_08482 [Trichuris suis]
MIHIRSYILRMTINNVVEVWNDVSKQCMHHVWRKLIPDLICDFKDFVPYAELSWLGFEEMEYQDGQRHFELSTG